MREEDARQERWLAPSRPRGRSRGLRSAAADACTALDGSEGKPEAERCGEKRRSCSGTLGEPAAKTTGTTSTKQRMRRGVVDEEQGEDGEFQYERDDKRSA